jgi:hypothetical protein
MSTDSAAIVAATIAQWDANGTSPSGTGVAPKTAFLEGLIEPIAEAIDAQNFLSSAAVVPNSADGWGAYPGNPATVYKLPIGRLVFCQGGFQKTNTTPSSSWGTVPVGYRPAVTLEMLAHKYFGASSVEPMGLSAVGLMFGITSANASGYAVLVNGLLWIAAP